MKIDKKGKGRSMQEEPRETGEGREDDALLHFYQACVWVAMVKDARCRHGSLCKDNLLPYHSVSPFLTLSLPPHSPLSSSFFQAASSPCRTLKMQLAKRRLTETPDHTLYFIKCQATLFLNAPPHVMRCTAAARTLILDLFPLSSHLHTWFAGQARVCLIKKSNHFGIY